MKYSDVQRIAGFLNANGIGRVETAVVLGTGLSSLLDHVHVITTIPYHAIPDFPASTIEYHKGQLVYGKVGERFVLIMQGRFHYYEGYAMHQITLPVRVMKELGCTALLLSNAAGSMNKTFRKGDLVVLTDHINFLPDNPLRGLTDPALGPRFPDMSRPYHEALSRQLMEQAARLNLRVHEGVYAAVMGPNLETRAEYRFLAMSGADLVGMSTVPEVIVANQVQLPCAAISVVTDECDPDNLKPIDIDEIIRVAGQADKGLGQVFADTIKTLEI